MVIETELPTCYYHLDRMDVDNTHLTATDTVTECPYKGSTSAYWTARIGDSIHLDTRMGVELCDPTRLPLAGLVASTTRTSTSLWPGEVRQRPVTHFA